MVGRDSKSLRKLVKANLDHIKLRDAIYSKVKENYADSRELVNNLDDLLLFTDIVEKKNLSKAKLLISKREDVDRKNLNGETLLHVACFSHCNEIIDVLIQKGADISVKDANGKSPLAMLNRDHKNYRACSKLIVKKLAKLSYGNLPHSAEDMNLITTSTRSQIYFIKCTDELKRLETIKFFGPHSYYSALSRPFNLKRLARRVQIKEFKRNFKADVKTFNRYKKEAYHILDEIVRAKEELPIVEERLKSVFGDYLPDLVLRNMAENLSVEDLPLE